MILLAFLAVCAASLVIVMVLVFAGGGDVELPSPNGVVHAVPGYTLRSARPADVDAFVRIAGESKGMRFYGWDDVVLHQFARWWHSLSVPELRGKFLVAETNSGEIAGFTSLSGHRLPNQASIRLHLGRAHQTVDLGAALMRAAILVLQTTGAEAWVGAATADAETQRVMARLGYMAHPEIAVCQAPNGVQFELLWYQVGGDCSPPI